MNIFLSKVREENWIQCHILSSRTKSVFCLCDLIKSFHRWLLIHLILTFLPHPALLYSEMSLLMRFLDEPLFCGAVKLEQKCKWKVKEDSKFSCFIYVLTVSQLLWKQSCKMFNNICECGGKKNTNRKNRQANFSCLLFLLREHHFPRPCTVDGNTYL